MINEISASPKPQNKNANIACAVLMSAFAALTVLYALIDRYRGLVGLAAMVFLTAGIYIYTKYISAKYYYDITTDSEGKGLFVVRKLVGKRQTTMYMTRLSHIYDVSLEGKEERRSKKYAAGISRYSFTPTLMPDTVCLISVSSRAEKSEIMIECTAEFANLLFAYSKEEGERERLEEDEI